jgi:hypothetical protein
MIDAELTYAIGTRYAERAQLSQGPGRQIP